MSKKKLNKGHMPRLQLYRDDCVDCTRRCEDSSLLYHGHTACANANNSVTCPNFSVREDSCVCTYVPHYIYSTCAYKTSKPATKRKPVR